MDDFVARLLFIRSLMQAPKDPHVPPYILSASSQLDQLRHAARAHVCGNFNRGRRLQSFGNLFLQRIGPRAESMPDVAHVRCLYHHLSPSFCGN